MQMKTLALLAVVVVNGYANVGMAQTRSLKWKVEHEAWTSTHEKLFEEFVAKLGEGREKGVCFTTDECLKSPVANPMYAKKNPSGLRNIFADCADLPHILRGYFAWMNGLPFSYQNGVAIADPQVSNVNNSPEFRALKYQLKDARVRLANARIRLASAGFLSRLSIKSEIRDIEREIKYYLDQMSMLAGLGSGPRSNEDVRYSKNGNKVTSRKIVKDGDNINDVLDQIVMALSTASFRINAGAQDTGTIFRDTYPVTLDREGIKPGTILYDPAGHIAMVYKVTKDGRIYLIDAHPDNSLTRISFGEKFSRSPIIRGAGFLKFRPIRQSGTRHIPTSNSELADYSLQTYQGYPEVAGVNFQKAKFIKNGKNLSYFDYIRENLSLGDLKIDPIKELKIILNDLCIDMKDRVDSVEKAIEAGMDRRDHPARLPENIYGTHGDWETYSTPSRDARLKASIHEARSKTEEYIKRYNNGDPKIVTDSVNLMGDLADTYLDETRACELKIKNSNSDTVRINLDEAIESIFNFSFDPYHCVELRWGLTSNSDLSSCRQSEEKFDWYRAERRLRNQIERDYEQKMDLTLRELQNSSLGVSQKPNISLRDLLDL